MRERKEESSGASSGGDRNAKSRAKRSSKNDKDVPPGAHHPSSRSRRSRSSAMKGKPSSNTSSKRDAKRSSNDNAVSRPGAHHASPFKGSAKERIARKARHDGDNNSGSSAVISSANNRSTGPSSDPKERSLKERIARKARHGDSNRGGSSTAEAELIEDDEDEDEENQSQPSVVVGDEEGLFEDNQDESNPASNKRPWGIISCIIFVLLVIVLGVVGAFIWFTGNNNKEEVLPETVPLENNTNATLEEKTDSPTSSLTTPLLLYDPPSREDCRAISRNETIAGQENVPQSNFGISLDVTLTVEGNITPITIETLMHAIQTKLLPPLAGCNDIEFIGRRRDLVSSSSLSLLNPIMNNNNIRGGGEEGVQRKLSSTNTNTAALTNTRRSILNAFVKGKEEPEEICQEDSKDVEKCHRILVDLTIFLKRPVKFLDIVALISDAKWKAGDNLVPPLGLGIPFLLVKMTAAEIWTPTNAPSSMPTNRPSWAPSDVPSDVPSDGPTPWPSFMPFPGSTPRPTPSPTLLQ